MQTRIHFGIRCCRLWWPPSVRKHELIVPLAIADSRTTRTYGESSSSFGCFNGTGSPAGVVRICSETISNQRPNRRLDAEALQHLPLSTLHPMHPYLYSLLFIHSYSDIILFSIYPRLNNTLSRPRGRLYFYPCYAMDCKDGVRHVARGGEKAWWGWGVCMSSKQHAFGARECQFQIPRLNIYQ